MTGKDSQPNLTNRLEQKGKYFYNHFFPVGVWDDLPQWVKDQWMDYAAVNQVRYQPESNNDDR